MCTTVGQPLLTSDNHPSTEHSALWRPRSSRLADRTVCLSRVSSQWVSREPSVNPTKYIFSKRVFSVEIPFHQRSEYGFACWCLPLNLNFISFSTTFPTPGRKGKGKVLTAFYQRKLTELIIRTNKEVFTDPRSFIPLSSTISSEIRRAWVSMESRPHVYTISIQRLELS